MSPRTAELPLADADADANRARLQQLGYKQELKRGLSYVAQSAQHAVSLFLASPFHPSSNFVLTLLLS